MPGDTVVWFGQPISFVGTGMTQFGPAICAWLETGDGEALAWR